MTDLKGDRGGLRAEVGHDISISCDCRMSDTREAGLYSIKWYRDDREFFRYIPTGRKENVLGKKYREKETLTNILFVINQQWFVYSANTATQDSAIK